MIRSLAGRAMLIEMSKRFMETLITRTTIANFCEVGLVHISIYVQHHLGGFGGDESPFEKWRWKVCQEEAERTQRSQKIRSKWRCFQVMVFFRRGFATGLAIHDGGDI